MKKLLLMLFVITISIFAMASCTEEKCEHKNTKDVAAVPATCTDAGYTAGKVCSDCGEAISGHTEIPALDPKGQHKLVIQQAVEPTCSSTGQTQGEKCVICTYVKAPQNLDKLPHTPENSKEYPATCIASGSSGGTHCKICFETITEPTITNPTGHTFGEWVETTAPQVDDEGEETRTCTVEGCGKTETRPVDALTNTTPDGTENDSGSTPETNPAE